MNRAFWTFGWAFTFLLFCHFKSIAQNDQQTYNFQKVIPPSPNAASLGKYIDMPVNLYTGVPEINIPIYELKGRTISVPISLTYHASGIKVGENASCVGLGWALQAGGLITRSVRGLADEDQGPGYLTIRSYYKNPGDLSAGATATNNSSAFSDSSLQVSEANGNIDTQPDLYMFSALGRIYKFLILGDGTIVTQPYSNIKVTFNYSNVTQSTWTIILEDGTQLLFGGNGFCETTTTQETNSLSDPFISSWYLQSITSSTGEVITFTYTGSTGSVTYDSYVYESDYTLNRIEINGHVDGVPPTTTKPSKTIIQTSSTNLLTLASIESEVSKVYFDATYRNDLTGASAISGIRVFSKLQNKTIKSYILNYVYSSPVNGNTFSGGYTAPPYRLKLNSLEEVPTDNSLAHKIWSFTYNLSSLPSRKSYAQDYWGYYNGATNNTTLKPLSLLFNPDNFSYGNRAADPTSMMAETLTQITYPTGGSTQFTYEPNSYLSNEEQFQNTSVNQSLYLTYNQPNFSNTTSTTLTITNSQYFKFTFTASFSATYLQDYGSTTTLASVNLKNSSGTILTSAGVHKPATGTTVSITSTSILLSPGTYTFTMSSINTSTDFSSSAQTVSLNSSFSYQQSLGIQTINHLVGGLRIKTITQYDNVNNSNALIKNYNYSNAYVISPVDPNNDFVSNVTDRMYDCNPPYSMTGCGLPGCLASSVIFYERSGVAKFGLGSIQGGTVGYGTVTETLGVNGEGGKNVYSFTNVTDQYYPQSKVVPYPPLLSMDYERGLLLEQDILNAYGATIKKIVNTYQYINKGAITTYKDLYKFNILSSCFSFNYLADYITRAFYSDQTNQVQKLTTTTTEYNSYTNDPIVTTENYFYDNPANIQPTRIEITDSKGLLNRTYNRTALEKSDINAATPLSANASAAIDALIQKNQVSTVLETENWIGPSSSNLSLLTRSLTNYRNWTSTLTLPETFQQQIKSNSIETRYQATAYDTKGNLLEQQKSGNGILDVKNSYLYDYTANYPIAEVKNAGQSDIAYTSFEADGTGGWTFSGTSFMDPNAVTGKNVYSLSNGSISKSGLSTTTTYIVSYWSNSGQQNVNGTSAIIGRTVNGYSYFEHVVTNPTAGIITVSGTGVIDELRLYPSSTLMTTYCYSPLIGVSCVCDPNNRIVYYDYDGFGRLTLIKDQDLRIVKKYCYNYSGQPESCTVFYNTLQSGTFQKNCPSSATGSLVTYSVPANTYYSTVSQAEANNIALANVNMNGQNYANTNGTCSWFNVAKSGTFTRNNCPSGSTGSSVTYTVSAGAYSSTISQVDADSKAQNDVNTNGQNYANTNGTCTPSNVPVTCINYTGLGGFVVVYTNSSNGAQYTFGVSTSTTQYTMGNIPPGTYTITMSKTGNTTTKYLYGIYTSTCTNITYGVVSATFSNVVVSAAYSCNGVQIDTLF